MLPQQYRRIGARHAREAGVCNRRTTSVIDEAAGSNVDEKAQARTT